MDRFVERLLQGAMSTGWDGIENAGKAAREAMERERSQAMAISDDERRLVRAVLSTPEGDKLLQLLLAKTALRGPNEQQLQAATVEQYALACAKREGQNALVFMLINMARGVDAGAEATNGVTT